MTMQMLRMMVAGSMAHVIVIRRRGGIGRLAVAPHQNHVAGIRPRDAVVVGLNDFFFIFFIVFGTISSIKFFKRHWRRGIRRAIWQIGLGYGWCIWVRTIKEKGDKRMTMTMTMMMTMMMTGNKTVGTRRTRPLQWTKTMMKMMMRMEIATTP